MSRQGGDAILQQIKSLVTGLLIFLAVMFQSFWMPELAVGSMICPITVRAAETDVSLELEKWLEQDALGFEDVEESLNEISNSESFHFTDTVKGLVKGEIPLNTETLKNLAFQAIFSELQNQKNTAVQVLLLVIAAAVIMNFTDIMEKSKTSGVGFYVMYLLLFTLLINAFYGMSRMLETSLGQVIGFMKALLPSYFAASVFASGSISGAAFYEFSFLVIMAIQWLMKYVFLPLVELYVLFGMLNHLSGDERLSRLADLMRVFTEWSLKTMMAAVIGMQAVQSLILPAVDSVKTTTVNKVASSVPGIGNLFGNVTEMVLGSALLVKNAIGVAGMIVVVLICLAPLARLAFCALLYRAMAAIIQPVSDKRLNACVASVSDGAGLLLKIMASVAMLFFLTIAMVTASIGG